jgi:hypothetical protein
MTVEAVVAIASGIAANSLTLVAFGIDSAIELASAGILVWRLTLELRRGDRPARTNSKPPPMRDDYLPPPGENAQTKGVLCLKSALRKKRASANILDRR